jgi:hypothetical protein
VDCMDRDLDNGLVSQVSSQASFSQKGVIRILTSQLDTMELFV